MYKSGETFSNNGGVFASQLINLYTQRTLGEVSPIFLLLVAAFTTMFSTTITTYGCLAESHGNRTTEILI